MAVRGIKWPGRANLVVSLVAIHKAPGGRNGYLMESLLSLSRLASSSSDAFEPKPLPDNRAQIAVGSYFLGEGFLLSHEKAAQLIASDLRNAEVIFPVINGQEINSDPEQRPGRSIINFFDWSSESSNVPSTV